MNIQIKVNLDIERQGKYFIVGSLSALKILMGSEGVSGNYHLYKVTKENTKFKVPVEEVKKRIKIKQMRIEKESKQLIVMKQIMGGK